MPSRPVVFFDSNIFSPVFEQNSNTVSDFLGSIDKHLPRPLAVVILVNHFGHTIHHFNTRIARHPELSGLLFANQTFPQDSSSDLPHTSKPRANCEFYPSRAALPSRRTHLGEISASIQDGNLVYIGFGRDDAAAPFETFARVFNQPYLLLDHHRHISPFYGASKVHFSKPDEMAARDFPSMRNRLVNSATQILARRTLPLPSSQAPVLAQ